MIETTRPVFRLTRDWGDRDSVSLYLDRCQIDTPLSVIDATWAHVERLRDAVGKVVDFGAGDGRFAKAGMYRTYVGFEIDEERSTSACLPSTAKLLNRCAFSDRIVDADLCIGNPPYVRNQDLPSGWREQASHVLRRRTGVSVSGLANAWQYFFLLALASLKDDGLSVLLLPFEWVSRPSARALRDYIRVNRWNVQVYRLADAKFSGVLTTSSITIVDKACKDGVWSYYEETADGRYRTLSSPTGSQAGVIEYLRGRDIPAGAPRAIRGLSPGTQKVLTLTEGERVRSGLRIGCDVVPCVTSLRNLQPDVAELDSVAFRHHYRQRGHKCWLIRTDRAPTAALRSYLDAIPESEYQTATCLERGEWWRFNMPPVPRVLVAQSFNGEYPKGVVNRVRARAVGGVCGIYNVTDDQVLRLLDGLKTLELGNRVVAYSNGFRKLEINQLNTLLRQGLASVATDA